VGWVTASINGMYVCMRERAGGGRRERERASERTSKRESASERTREGRGLCHLVPFRLHLLRPTVTVQSKNQQNEHTHIPKHIS
jgi:hypothetical protein